MRIKHLRNDKYERAKPFNEFIEKEFPQLLTEEKPELNLVAGGDGSMLHAISTTIDSQIPYLGKAMGTLNFLMNSFDNDYEIIQNILEDRIKLDVFESNTIAVYIDGKKVGKAVNDIILGNKVTDYCPLHEYPTPFKAGDEVLHYKMRSILSVCAIVA